MLMSDRKFAAGNEYRYGFNGKELDSEDPVQYDYGLRIYDPRLGRFKSFDPFTTSFPMLTPYQFASNSPLANIDLDGGEAKYYTVTINELYDAKGKLIQVTASKVYEKSKEAGWHTNGSFNPFNWSHVKEGERGNGTLFTFIRVKKFEDDKQGIKKQEIVKIGEAYENGPEEGNPIVKTGGYGGFAFYAENGQGYETRVGSFEDLTMVEITKLSLVKSASEVGVWENATEWLHEYGSENEKGKKEMADKILEEVPNTTKYAPNSSFCNGCLPGDDHSGRYGDVVQIDEKGDIKDTLHYNQQTKKVDTLKATPPATNSTIKKKKG
ncbi:MAG: RHS repeat-associated core domain-containing protein [Ferruginibacter sp.]